MLFIQNHLSKSKHNEDLHHTSNKCNNKQKKAIHLKISQILGLSPPHTKDAATKPCCKTTGEKYKLFESSSDIKQQNILTTAKQPTHTIQPHPQQPLPIRHRKLTPPPPPIHLLFNEFPSTKSNRKNKNNNQKPRSRRKHSDLEQPRTMPKTCVNIVIGRIVCRKYVPRLEGVLEEEEQEIGGGING